MTTREAPLYEPNRPDRNAAADRAARLVHRHRRGTPNTRASYDASTPPHDRRAADDDGLAAQ